MNVLVIDDEEDTRRCVRDILEQEGFEVTEAADALDAAALLRRRKYDLILLDVMLPGIDGREFARYLSSHRKRIPILAISCRHDPETKAWMKRCGCRGFVEKPFGPSELLRKIGALSKEPK